jgi:D-serine deaminase-like pyridoxal phosphate-dependent protein
MMSSPSLDTTAIGVPADRLETPAVTVDLAVLDHNLRKTNSRSARM